MGLKKFSIYSLIIFSLVVVTCIVCCFIRIETPFKINGEPDSITVYNYEKYPTGRTTNSNTYNELFNELNNEFKNSSNLSIFQRIASGANIYNKPSMDVKQEKPTWTTAKSKAVTMEISYKEKQSVIVQVDGKTRQIDFYGLAFVLNPSILVHEVSLYYKTSVGGLYVSSPILIQMKTNKLYKIVNSLDLSK